MIIPVDFVTWLMIDNAHALATKHGEIFGVAFNEHFGLVVTSILWGTREDHRLLFYAEVLFVGTKEVFEWFEKLSEI